MLTLAIESTAHTFGVAVLKEENILSNETHTFTTEKGGMIPNLVADHHKKYKNIVLEAALKKANTNLEQIDIVAYSNAPGLAPALMVGRDFAKELNKPLVGVNHIVAHLEIGLKTTKAQDPIFVFTSGANTQIIAHEGGKYRVFGEALSIAVGNALDKLGRELELGFPAGPKIEQIAKKGKFIQLPYKVKGMDVEFSGILTKAMDLYQKGASKEDICFSFQETCFAMLAEVTERALAHCEKDEILLIGGVARNKRFSEMLNTMAEERNAKAYTVPFEYAGDNAAMIGYLGYLQYKANKKTETKPDFYPRQRIDEIETFWKS
ncbi:tRNA (adenosine(37)-N6)-threonylcarbamoyltransferase complex transferase subunit TsaD [archaeon]|jgi:N6-L-threonylcarbamoyladenine synthase|nr:tRNA (adenosine(37)-N6)-threonylcarbamoyltransferase complex transferase subunit TsaD [archaeon]MBT4416939.1 tRNA (adenosine(37)-N6)-threonylcarbamoyltransferase complex transferase subunit TsaD [archaeon]